MEFQSQFLLIQVFQYPLNGDSSLNGVTVSQVAITFDKGIFSDLQDGRATQLIGGAEIITNEQATTPTQLRLSAHRKTRLPHDNAPAHKWHVAANKPVDYKSAIFPENRRSTKQASYNYL